MNDSAVTPVRGRLFRLSMSGLVTAGVAVASGATALGFVGEWHWALDLFAHFRGQYFIFLLVAAPLLLALRRRVATAVACTALLANVWCLLPLWRGEEQEPPVDGARPLRVLAFNVLFDNPRHADIAAFLRASEADIVFLQEISTGWRPTLAALADVYPHQKFTPQTNMFGYALLSRRPWERLEERQFAPVPSPSPVARFQWEGRPFLFVGAHPVPPAGGANTRLRDEALHELGTFLQGRLSRQVVAGDLNVTRWSASWQRLCRRARLRDSAEGFGWQPTWMAGSLFQIPIDHVLHSGDWRVMRRALGPDLGSDHRAVIADLVWRE